MEGDAVGFMG